MEIRPVRTPAPRAAAVLGALLLSLAAAGWGCTYSPRPANGQLLCGPSGECPEGYSCYARMTAPAGLYCFDDNAPRNTDAGGPPLVEGGLPDGGLTPVDRPPPAERPALDAAVATVRDRYVGNWTFGANAVELTDCGPGTTPVQRSLQGAPMTIFAGDLRPGGGPADLTAMDICELYLRLDSSGTLLLGADQAGCVSVDTIPEGTFRSTYAAYEFSFFTGNGQTGTLTLADYDVLWEELDGNGNVIGAIVCRQTVSNATLAKAVAVK